MLVASRVLWFQKVEESELPESSGVVISCAHCRSTKMTPRLQQGPGAIGVPRSLLSCDRTKRGKCTWTGWPSEKSSKRKKKNRKKLKDLAGSPVSRGSLQRLACLPKAG